MIAPPGKAIAAAKTAAPRGVRRGAWAVIPKTGDAFARFIPRVYRLLGCGKVNSAKMTALPLSQHPYHVEALQKIGADAQLIAQDGAQLVTLRRRLPGLGVISMASREPLWPQGARELLRKVRLVNADGGGLRSLGFVQLMTPATVAELDITGDWLSRARGKWRNRLTRAKPLRIKSHALGPGDAWLLERCAEQARARGYRDLPAAYALAFPSARVFEARLGSTVIAAMVMLIHAPVATYHLGWCGEDGRARDAHRQVLAHAVQWLSDAGITRVDLGTVDTDAAPGLARFKLGTGARAVRLGGTWLRWR